MTASVQRAWVILVLTLFTIVAQSPSWSQSIPEGTIGRAPIPFNIPAQPLASALNAFAETSRLQVSYPAELAKGRLSSPVIGSHSPEAALGLLLDGTGLTYRLTDNATITLVEEVPAMAAPAPIQPQSSLDLPPPPEEIQKPVKVPEIVVKEVRKRDDAYVEVLNSGTSTGSWLGLMPREQVNVIQVVPRAVIEDRGQPAVLNILDKIPGIRPVAPAYTDSGAGIRSRGFENFESFVNGNRLASFSNPVESANIERIEVFKGPAAIQYGITDPGGTLNILTKRPVRDRLLNFKGMVGSYDFYRGEVDLGGAIPGTGGHLLSRFNLAYQNAESHRDFDQGQRWFVAPALRWEFSPRTFFDVEFNYQRNEFRFNRGLNPQPFILGLPFKRSFMEANLPLSTNDSYSVFTTLEHRFGNGDWGVRQRFGYFNIVNTTHEINTGVDDIDALGSLARTYFFSTGRNTYMTLSHQIFGDWDTGPIKHKSLIGVELARNDFGYEFFSPVNSAENPVAINAFTPQFGQWQVPPRSRLTNNGNAFENYGDDIIGLYFDHRIRLLENLTILGGGRFDWVKSFYNPGFEGGVDTRNERFGFSPRAGIVYTPFTSLDVFFNYSTSFRPNLFSDSAGNLFEPETGKQYEGGLRYDLIPSQLRASVAVFSITKDNVLVPDPTDPTNRRSILSGQQKSDGFELNLMGRPLEGWDIIAGYSHFDARVTKDTDAAQIGLPLVDAQKNHVSLWSKYELEWGALKGVWLGYGLNYVDQRRSSFANAAFMLPSYVQHDVAVGYRYKNLSAQVNLENLTSERVYFSHGNNIHLQAPINVRASVRMQF
jgi:iron complex outermembrane recepter protein